MTGHSKAYRDRIKKENGDRYRNRLAKGNESATKHYNAHKDDPAFKEKRRQTTKKWYEEKKKLDPAFVAKRREAARLHYHKTKKLKGDQPNNE